ncbi:unnamed protein product [Ranitomeya imitator]|uniref:Uncharacterized protein n=1 Tax=Ranitomeya imitator TaxID=111125 RepID=A0ABN9LC28_9NEOB|nr:unnamed protein product [Ranitomeya imitator]
MSAVSGTEPSPAAATGRVFFQTPLAAPGAREDSPQMSAQQHKQQQQRRQQQGKVTVKYDRKELRKRLVLEEWIVEQLSELYGCETRRWMTSSFSGRLCQRKAMRCCGRVRGERFCTHSIIENRRGKKRSKSARKLQQKRCRTAQKTRQIRRNEGYSMREIAKKLEISYNGVYYYFREEHKQALTRVEKEVGGPTSQLSNKTSRLEFVV